MKYFEIQEKGVLKVYEHYTVEIVNMSIEKCFSPDERIEVIKLLSDLPQDALSSQETVLLDKIKALRSNKASL
jgi:hypothetical protein